MNHRLKRACIYPKDIARILGKSEKYAQALLRTIKKELGKQKHHSVSIQEFCAYKGLKIEDIASFMQD